VAKRILAPAGMTSSSFLPDSEAIKRNLATAYMVDFDGAYFPAPTFVLGTIPAGNLYATAGDLGRFMAALFNGGVGPGGPIVSKESQERMFTVQFPGTAAADFGFGFFVNRLWDRKLVTHFGAVYGFASAFAAMPAEKIGVVVLNNVDCANGFDNKVMRTALRLMLNRKLDAGIPPLPAPSEGSAVAMGEYAGKYTAPRREAWASVEGDGLRLQILGANQTLRPLGADRFIADGRLGYGAEYQFARDDAGKVVAFQADGVRYERVPAYRPSSEVPEGWRKYVGRYGWPHNIMLVYVRDGRLTCLVEWFYEYPLETVGPGVFAFPDYGLYEGEKIDFIADGRGDIVEARMGTVPFKRLPPTTGSLIDPADHWAIWATLIAVAAMSIVLEQKKAIARKVTGPVIALFGGMALSNVGFIPTESVSYDVIGEYLMPLVIPLFLMRTNVLRVFRETGRLFVVFHLASLGTILGALVAVLLMGHLIPHLSRIGAAMTGSYIGGSINFFALVDMFKPPKDLVNATIVADSGVMALYFLVLIALPGIPFVRRIFPETEVSRGF
jgi:hypothetical protein